MTFWFRGHHHERRKPLSTGGEDTAKQPDNCIRQGCIACVFFFKNNPKLYFPQFP